jgi:hypothetical protein
MTEPTITHETFVLTSPDGDECCVWRAHPYVDDVPECEVQRMIVRSANKGEAVQYRFPKGDRTTIHNIWTWSKWKNVMVSQRDFYMLRMWALTNEAEHATKH